jgi:hypothetical protein
MHIFKVQKPIEIPIELEVSIFVIKNIWILSCDPRPLESEERQMKQCWIKYNFTLVSLTPLAATVIAIKVI